jgi:hypothetical protein
MSYLKLPQKHEFARGHDTAILIAFQAELAARAIPSINLPRISLRLAAKSGIVAPLDAPF